MKKNLMKTLAVSVLALVMAATMTACGGDKNPSDGSSNSTASTTAADSGSTESTTAADSGSTAGAAMTEEEYTAKVEEIMTGYTTIASDMMTALQDVASDPDGALKKVVEAINSMSTSMEELGNLQAPEKYKEAADMFKAVSEKMTNAAKIYSEAVETQDEKKINEANTALTEVSNDFQAAATKYAELAAK